MRRTMTALLAIGALAVPALAQDPVSISPIGFGPELFGWNAKSGPLRLDLGIHLAAANRPWLPQ